MKTYIESPAEFEAMTPEQRSAYRCAVDAAHAAGGRVEAIDTCLRNPSRWVPDPNPSWSWKACIYRIARKPLEVWHWIDGQNYLSPVAFYSKTACEKDFARREDAGTCRAVRFIEAPNE